MQNLKIREYSESEYHFILNSYLKSMRTNESNKSINNEVYYSGQKKVFDKFFKRSKCLVACNPQDEDQIYSYLIFESIDGIDIVHFYYTKYTYRKLGIMSTLFKVARVLYPLVLTHLPKKLKEKEIYNPYVR